MNALIIDDEYKAREILELMIRAHAPEIEQIKSGESGQEADIILEQYHPDLVFLDIKMPDQNGFEWLQSLAQRPFDVVFTTAYDQYAIQAIRFAAFDYLLKPVDPEDLRTTIERYLDRKPDRKSSIDNLLYNVGQADPNLYRLTIPTREETHYVNATDIIRCEADGNYTHFYLKSGQRLMTSRPIGHYAGLLPCPPFIRCHKSHLVNQKHIQSMSSTKIQLVDGSEAEVSRRRLSEVRSILSVNS